MEDRRQGRFTAGGRVRADALPEFTRYRDDGCDVSASCFNCPLPRCRYEEPGGLRAILNAQRDEKMHQLRLKGMGVEELADRFQVSRRTVFRVLNARPDSRGPNRRQDDFEPIPIRDLSPRREANCA
jgi:hypothetical protein